MCFSRNDNMLVHWALNQYYLPTVSSAGGIQTFSNFHATADSFPELSSAGFEHSALLYKVAMVRCLKP